MRSKLVRFAALVVLAAIGDDRAWDQIFAALERRLARLATDDVTPPPVGTAVIYLSRHCSMQDRIVALVTLLRSSWSHMTSYEAEWLEENWVDATPQGPDARAVRLPDTDRLTQSAQRWVYD